MDFLMKSNEMIMTSMMKNDKMKNEKMKNQKKRGMEERSLVGKPSITKVEDSRVFGQCPSSKYLGTLFLSFSLYFRLIDENNITLDVM